MLSKTSILCLTFALSLTASTAFAQAEDPVPLKNWPAPLYWQPQAGEGGHRSAMRDRLFTEREDAVASAALGVPPPLMMYVAITPCRLVDTRTASMPLGYGPPSIVGGGTRTVSAPGGGCGVPAAPAYSVTVTVVPPGGAMMRWLTLYATGTTRPNVATLNDRTGLIINNAAIVSTGTPLGSFDVYVTDTTDVIIDLNGYYIPPSALTLAAGTAGSPSLTFGGDDMSGVYSTTPGTLSISAGGLERLRANGNGVSVTGSLDFTNSITKSGQILLRADDSDVFLGLGAIGSLSGSANSALGALALNSLTSAGAENTAIGYAAGTGLADASQNVAVGAWALAASAGSENTALGYEALKVSTGAHNTALGKGAGAGATTGDQNTLVGYHAADNALEDCCNVAVGDFAGRSLSTGNSNVVVGSMAGYALSTGSGNVLVGPAAGYSVGAGNNNIGLGDRAGQTAGSGSWNIHIGHWGVAGDTGTIRIGDSNHHAKTFIAAIRGVAVTGGQNVQIDADGQLGSVTSSIRFKQDIEDLGSATDTLMALRPVRFRYKALGPNSSPQYGLIAEEVFSIAPDLVGRDKDGEIDSVAYDKVYAMMLKELQEQRRVIDSQREQLLLLGSRVAELEGRAKPSN